MTPDSLNDNIAALVTAANAQGGFSAKWAAKMEKRLRKSIILAVNQNLDKGGKISNTDEQYITDLVRNAHKAVFTPTEVQLLVLNIRNSFDAIQINTVDAISEINGFDILVSRLSNYQKAFIAQVEQQVLASFTTVDGRLQTDIRGVLVRAAQTGMTRNEILTQINNGKIANAVDNITKIETHEAYYGYQRATANATAEAYNLTYWAYIGSLKIGVKKGKKIVGGSRPFCQHIITNMQGVLSSKDFPRLVNQFAGTRGFKKTTTIGSIVVDCGGWNCRHIMLPITKKKALSINPNI